MKIICFKKKYLSFIFVIFCTFLIFHFPDKVKSGVNEGLAICADTIIPSLFPFMTLSSYIIKSEITGQGKCGYRLSQILFRQPQAALSCIIISMIGGFPVGIRSVSELYENGRLTEEQSQRLCLFCINPGPAFVITALGENMLGNRKAGVIIYASLCISALLCGIFSSFVGEKCEITESRNPSDKSGASLSASVTNSVQSVFSICGWIVLFSAFTGYLTSIFKGEYLNIFISAVEITKGCVLLRGKTPLYIITALISFGGLCVHCQILGYLKKVKIKYIHFLISRILSGVLSGIICYMLLLFFPVELDVFADCDNTIGFSFSFSYSAFFIFIFMCVILIFDIDRNRKYDKI